MRPRLVLIACAALAVVGCGGGHATRTVREGAVPAPPVGSTPAPGIDPHVLPPKRVPTHGTRPADPEARRVIEGWLRALRHGHLRAAARSFAIPSVFQNATPVLHLDDATEVLAVVSSFPCGAVATRYSAAGRFTLVRFRLTERTGGDCGGAAGSTTGGAIRVAGGHIKEWYRLYDQAEVHPTGPLVDPGNLAA
ncbi:hypothetical protein DSM104299_02822 [Baekduia alba]|uniref:hypothetical protein n=1 Tax=Baekduia alba TaxID=2997333 RepID=UPI0023409830|nr:hypothetical protein [Baekduia alba]WCB94094.1 hypothetical protein DSM104299_02822 [Baekduia alba]